MLDDLPELRDAAFWDGVDQSFIPDKDAAISPKLVLHTDRADDVDPVTYELVRYSLLNINLEHSALLQKLAVSQIVILSRDFQTALMTEEGEVVLVGPGVQNFAKMSALGIQYALQKRSHNPGIAPGDIFFTNDCYVGSSHQQDGSLLAPVFVGDRLFCWVTNTLHYMDVGGIAAGSFCHAAQDAWHDPSHWPPVKIVEGGELREDIERLFVRQSRMPTVVSMDLRAAIASIKVVRTKIGELVERYGADVVKAVMRGMQDAGERLFVDRLRTIPDGRWSHRYYCEGAVPGDRHVHTMQVNITKQGERLIVDSRGTDPQAGSISMTFAGFSGAALAGIVTQMVPDLAGAFGGPYRRIEFRPTAGTIHCASFPAATSTSVFTIVMTINAIAIATTKMLSCGGADVRALALGATAPHAGGVINLGGVTPGGQPWHGGMSDLMLGSFGGSPLRDGMDFAGHWRMPGASGANVEDLEAEKPVLYLYRHGLPLGMDGAGRHRGGRGLRSGMWVRSDAHVIFALGEAVPGGPGVMGGSPGSRARVTLWHGSDLAERLAVSDIPCSIEELGPDLEELAWKTVSCPVRNGDVIETLFPNIAGYGDPLLRAVEAVLGDVSAGILEEATARRVYGVVFTVEGVDHAATDDQRRVQRRERLDGRDPSDPVTAPVDAQRVGELLHIVKGRWWCNGADLGPTTGNYRALAIVRERPVDAIGPEFASPFPDVADQFLCRDYICPVTGYIIDSEIALRTQPPLHDIRIGDRCD